MSARLLLAGSAAFVRTSDGPNFGAVWLSASRRSSATFAVSACADARLLLAELPGVSHVRAYEVLLGRGNNSRSVIRDRSTGRDLAAAATPGILACDEERPFWASWNRWSVAVGRGATPGNERFLHWTTNAGTYAISAIAVTTGAEFDGRWRFDASRGEFAVGK